MSSMMSCLIQGFSAELKEEMVMLSKERTRNYGVMNMHRGNAQRKGERPLLYV